MKANFTSRALTSCITAALVSACVTTDVVQSPEEEAQVAVEETTKGQEGAEALAIDESRSTVRFTGSRQEMSHTRTFARLGGQVSLDGDAVRSLWIVLDVKSLVHGNDALSMHLLSSDFFSAFEFPTAGFKSTEISASPGEGHTHWIKGHLEVRGVRQALSFPATLVVDPDEIHGVAEITLNRKDFGVNHPVGPDGDPIEDEVPVRVEILCKRAAPGSRPGLQTQ